MGQIPIEAKTKESGLSTFLGMPQQGFKMHSSSVRAPRQGWSRRLYDILVKLSSLVSQWDTSQFALSGIWYHSVHLNLRTTRVWVGAMAVKQKHPRSACISLKSVGIIAQPIARFWCQMSPSASARISVTRLWQTINFCLHFRTASGRLPIKMAFDESERYSASGSCASNKLQSKFRWGTSHGSHIECYNHRRGRHF